MSEQQKNVLESITPVELLMSADVKDVTEKEWSEALDACCKDLEALTKPSRVPMVRHMQLVVETQLSSRNRTATNDATIRYCTLADGFASVLRCYVARARKAAKPEVSSHTPPLSVDVAVPCTDRPAWSYFTAEDIAGFFVPGGFADLQKATAQKPVIPDTGLCWVKKLNGNWVLYHNMKDGYPWQNYVYSVDVRKVGSVWRVERHSVPSPYPTFHVALRSVEIACKLEEVPKPADENTPWIILTADGKLALDKCPICRG